MSPFPEDKNQSAALRRGKTRLACFLRECLAWMPTSATVTWRHVDRHTGIIIVDLAARATRGRRAREACQALEAMFSPNVQGEPRPSTKP